MEDIIAPIDKKVLKSELTEDKRLRFTNKSNNEIYIVTWKNAPNVLKEIGRLREIAFRAAGGGTGKSMDLDEYDLMENPYQQLIVWDPEAEEILGGYRYLLGDEVEFDAEGKPLLATAHMFNFSEKFLKDYLPTTIELGRSFVTLEYQSTRAGSKGLFALDNLWDGLGALTVVMPQVKYFFGKMTMYPSYNRFGRDMILYFLKKHFNDKDKLITPMQPLLIETDEKVLEKLFCHDTFKEASQESPELQQAHTEIKLTHNQQNLIRSERRPHISLTATNEFNGPILVEVPPLNNNFNYWFAGVGISYNLDALFKSKKKLKQARIATSKAEKNYQLVKEEIENKVHEAYVNLNEAYVRLHTQQKSVQLAHENFRIVRQRYLNGLSLITDMLDASNMQLDMELQLANYQIGILYQYYLLKKITGTL
jgi:hypothetical protein